MVVVVSWSLLALKTTVEPGDRAEGEVNMCLVEAPTAPQMRSGPACKTQVS